MNAVRSNKRWPLPVVLVVTVLITLTTVVVLATRKDEVSVPSDWAVEKELAWLPGGNLYLLALKASSEGADELWRISDDNDTRMLDPSPAFGCKPVDLTSIFELGDRLGIVGKCAGQGAYSIIATDPQDWTENSLLAMSRVAVENVAYSTDLSYGYGEVNIGYCRMLVRLQPNMQSMWLSSGDGMMMLEERPYPFEKAGSVCNANENFGPLSLARDAGVVVVGVTDGAVGESGSARYEASTHLAFFELGDESVTTLPLSVRNVSSVGASPDAELVAISINNRRSGGELWLASQDTGMTAKIREGDPYFDVTFSPSSGEIAAIYSTGKDRAVRKLDVTNSL